MEGRALWNAGKHSTARASSTKAHCAPFSLPSGGVLTLDSKSVITLVSDAVFRPKCTGTVDVTLADISSGSDLRDPFYASTLPQCYALAATTVIAYMLVVMLFITPRTFLSGGIVVLGRRGFTNGPSGSDAGIGIGGRPWLQKMAALTVAISLTIATANTFRVAQSQYDIGYMDAMALQTQVLNGMELKIIRVISDTFLWLAQAQTLIRLFPRQREKIIIKWTAFALISLNLIFSILNNFVYSPHNIARPYNIVEAIPAVSYLFHLALGLLYGAWVIYYGFTKRAYAFYHPQMRNICLVALMAIVAVIVPVVFFVLDISKPDVAGWGDYVRWVGAAAASVVVWEWVERIEALERNDKKDGVLGREVFDGDEMLEVSSFSDVSQPRRHHRDGEDGNGFSTGTVKTAWPAASRYRSRVLQDQEGREMPVEESHRIQTYSELSQWPMRPPPAITPVSRTDTGSAESTVYAVRHHPIGQTREPFFENLVPQEPSRSGSFDIEAQPDLSNGDAVESEKEATLKANAVPEEDVGSGKMASFDILRRLNPFYKKVNELPLEVSMHARKAHVASRTAPSSNTRHILGRLEDFAAVQADKLRDKARPPYDSSALTVTRIPAPPRRRNLREIMQEIDDSEVAREPHERSLPVMEDAVANANLLYKGRRDSPSRPWQSRSPAVFSPSIIARIGSEPVLASDQYDGDPRTIELGDTARPNESQGAVATPQSDSYRSIASLHNRSSNVQGLPVMRIPAPRRSRSDE